jgi:hypothetical protein
MSGQGVMSMLSGLIDTGTQPCTCHFADCNAGKHVTKTQGKTAPCTATIPILTAPWSACNPGQGYAPCQVIKPSIWNLGRIPVPRSVLGVGHCFEGTPALEEEVGGSNILGHDGGDR